MGFDPTAAFDQRVAHLPDLGVGISTEFGARHTGLDLGVLAREHGELVRFLEIGADLDRGLDEDALEWVALGRPTTYHFLDVNLEEAPDLDEAWCAATAGLARAAGAAWMCGDAGLWHVGARDRGHGTLLPPILVPESARAMAENVRALRERSGFEILPENPPAHVYVGNLHLLDYFARVAEDADCGLLLDVAHLAIYQRACGHAPRTGLDGFPLERVVELHVAGGIPFEHRGRIFVDDDHGTEILPETWELAALVIERCANLRAVVFECERNPLESVVAGFRRLNALRAAAAGTPPRPRVGTVPRPTTTDSPAEGLRVSRSRAGESVVLGRGTVPTLQRTLFRMELDPHFAGAVFARDPGVRADTGLSAEALEWLAVLDPRGVSADREGKRARMLAGNVVLEFTRTVHVAVERAGVDDLARGFASSREFHAAIRGDGSLPLAFAAWAARRLESCADPLVRAILALESELARARREVRPVPRPAAGEVVLAGSARLAVLPEGTLAAAQALSEGADPAEVGVVSGASETLLLGSRAGSWAGALREVAVERLTPPVAAALAAALEPLGVTGRAELAGKLDAGPAELERLVEDLVREGLLLRG